MVETTFSAILYHIVLPCIAYLSFSSCLSFLFCPFYLSSLFCISCLSCFSILFHKMTQEKKTEIHLILGKRATRISGLACITFDERHLTDRGVTKHAYLIMAPSLSEPRSPLCRT